MAMTDRAADRDPTAPGEDGPGTTGPPPGLLVLTNVVVIGLLTWSPLGRPAAYSYGAAMPWPVAALVVAAVVAGVTVRVAPLASHVGWTQALLVGLMWGAVGGFLAGLVLVPVVLWDAPVLGAAVMAWSFALFLAMGAGAAVGAVCGLADKAVADAFRKPVE